MPSYANTASPNRSTRVAFDLPIASAILACAMASYLVVGSLVPRSASIIAGQVALLAIPIIGVIAWRRGSWPHTAGLGMRMLGLRPPRLVFVIAAVLLGASLWYLNLRLVQLLPARPSASMDRIVTQPPLATTLVMLCVLPPICEEVLFRGVFARGLARGMPAVIAIIGSAIVFSFYHLSLVQAAPTFTLGFVLAWIALRADSIVPSIIVHALNNTIVVLLARDEFPGAIDWIDHNPAPAVIASSFSAIAGIILLALAAPVGLSPTKAVT